jgi:hypothetical protein
MDNMYQNTGEQVSTGVIYTEVLGKKQPIMTKVTSEPSFLPSNNNEQESTKISVRDLVKKFNQQ